MYLHRTVLVLAATVLLATGCGGEDDAKQATVSSADRIKGCLSEQPDATKTDCEGWEKDGELGDDGKHEGHESM